MSFYLAHPFESEAGKSLSPALKEMGLPYVRAKPSDIQVVVLSVSIQPGYACYVKNLPAFMDATLKSTRVFIGNRGYPIATVPHSLPWALPNLIYNFPKTPKNNVVETLRTHSEMIDGRGKNKSFIMTNVTLEKIKDLVHNNSDILSKTPHVSGTANLEAMKAIFMVQKVLSAFLLTHDYPAFRHESDVNIADGNVEVVRKKRKISNTSYVACITNVEDNVEDPMEEEKEDAKAATTTTPLSSDIQLTFAKPTLSGAIMWGSGENIPNSDGLYVPYVRDLAVADNTTVPSLFAATFLRSFASNQANMFEQMEKLRASWGVISGTDIGLEITHLCKCIDIALQAQAAVYPVYHNSVYEGTVLCGTGYSICIKDRVYKPVAYAELQKVVRDQSMHTKALKELSILLTGEEGSLTCTTIRQLSMTAKGAALDELSKQSVIKYALNLSFNDKYWPTNATHTKKMLGYLADTETPIPTDVPMHPRYLFTTDRVEEVMSAFGYQAPSFMLPNGGRRQLGSDDPPKNFLVRTVAVDAAVLDMKYMIENGFITNDIGNMSAKHRDLPLKGAIKGEIWKLLKELHEGNPEDSKPAAVTGELVQGGQIDDDLW